MAVTIIESTSEFEKFKSQFSEKSIIFPLFDPHVHPFCSTPSVLVCKTPENGEFFVLPVNHSECSSFFSNLDFLNTSNCLVLDKKYLNMPKSIDLEALIYSNGKNIDLNIRSFAHSWVTHPIYKIIDMLEHDFIKIEQILANLEKNEAFEFINGITIPVLSKLEKNGLKVDRYRFAGFFQKEELICDKDFVFSQYNHLTSTGRPSNRFGGVNYSAVNKTDGSRECFISRFDGGELFLIDFDSYHPRLISKLIGVELPSTSVHEYFGKMYFGKDVLSEDEYEESKKITFRMIYGNVQEEYKHIEFFKGIIAFIRDIWDYHTDNGHIQSVISKIRISADSDTKLFNYLIQNFETERNMLVLKDIMDVSSESKPILYTYDSLLFDVHPSEGLDYVDKVSKIMTQGEFPVKIYRGKNYDDIKLL